MPRDSTQSEPSKKTKPISVGRLRLGILLVIISWLPIATLSLTILHNNNILLNKEKSHVYILSVWGLQIALGLIGIYIAGKDAIKLVKAQGLRHVPRQLWQAVIHGEVEPHN